MRSLKEPSYTKEQILDSLVSELQNSGKAFAIISGKAHQVWMSDSRAWIRYTPHIENCKYEFEDYHELRSLLLEAGIK